MQTENETLVTPYELLAEYERRSLAHVAGVPEQIDAPGLWRGIAFRIGARHMVSNIAEINEILTFPILTHVPGTKPWLLGVANVRGNLVPVADLRCFLEGDRSQVVDSSRVIVVRQLGGAVGLLVDEVIGQRSFSDEHRLTAYGEDDSRYSRYVLEKYDLGELVWCVFSMATLVKTPDFLQAAA